MNSTCVWIPARCVEHADSKKRGNPIGKGDAVCIKEEPQAFKSRPGTLNLFHNTLGWV